MESHKRVLGIIYIVSAAFQVFILCVVSIFLSTIFAYAMSQANIEDTRIIELLMNLARYLPFVVILIFSTPTLIAGIGLLSGKKWAMTLALVMGCFKLFSFPIGTCIGIYAIWVYAEEGRIKTANP